MGFIDPPVCKVKKAIIPNPPFKSWRPGQQHILFSIPRISPCQSHPFAITSASSSNELAFIIHTASVAVCTLAEQVVSHENFPHQRIPTHSTNRGSVWLSTKFSAIRYIGTNRWVNWHNIHPPNNVTCTHNLIGGIVSVEYRLDYVDSQIG